MTGYFKKLKVKDRDEDENSKLMSLHIDEDKLLEKYKTTWAKIDNLKNIELNALPVNDDTYIKPK